MRKKIDIIVVNWNAGQQTLQAVESYMDYSSEQIYCNIIVVDNASSDNSLTILKTRVPALIANTQNLGFGKACNQAFAQSNADYILLLNPDTESSPEVLEGLVAFLEMHPGYGVVGPRQLDEDGNILRTCARFPTFSTSLFDVLGLSKLFPKIFTPAPVMTDWDHLQSRDVDQVMGSYMLIRKSVLDITGFMDDDFFVYGEDRDLSKRIYNAGFKIFYNAQYSIVHEGGATGHKVKAQRLFYSLSSRRTYWKKHLGYSRCFILTSLSIMIEPFLRIIDTLLKEKRLAFKTIGSAYLMYFNHTIKN